jgi:hypothetical protein
MRTLLIKIPCSHQTPPNKGLCVGAVVKVKAYHVVNDRTPCLPLQRLSRHRCLTMSFRK